MIKGGRGCLKWERAEGNFNSGQLKDYFNKECFWGGKLTML